MNEYEMAGLTLALGRPKVERSADGTSTTLTFSPKAPAPPITTYTFVDRRTPEERFVDDICARLERGGFVRADRVVMKS
jgi:hypothetical protein